jgi:hypothetical protein
MPTPSQTILSPQAVVADGRLRDALVRAATRGERNPRSLDVKRLLLQPFCAAAETFELAHPASRPVPG